ncbi:hypothetical protein AaE_007753 [Aphanomyces astaci]|uniref:Uncharacterized protein n=2 Tax=Aphanomyces astaci TaxID=112090 RepID=A0A6A4ZWQ0_APHAT|nr:hypothetical protein AaE_007753 [Aphanomyces astaci]
MFALLELNSVNMTLTVRGRLKSQRVSKADTPDSAMYLVKWKENRSDLLVEINGRDTAMMSVKKTVAFVKTCTKTALLKFKRGPGISVSRVSA